jgi:hypothetical protein
MVWHRACLIKLPIEETHGRLGGQQEGRPPRPVARLKQAVLEVVAAWRFPVSRLPSVLSPYPLARPDTPQTTSCTPLPGQPSSPRRVARFSLRWHASPTARPQTRTPSVNPTVRAPKKSGGPVANRRTGWPPDFFAASAYSAGSYRVQKKSPGHTAKGHLRRSPRVATLPLVDMARAVRAGLTARACQGMTVK